MPAAPVLCDYCRQAINLFADDALLVGVYRRVDADEWRGKPSDLLSGDELALRFCSQRHLAEYAARVRLPDPTSAKANEAKFWAGVVASGLATLVVLGLAGYGAFALIR